VAIRIVNPAAFAERPAAVLFDLDDTLYDYAPPHRQAMDAVRQKVRKALNTAAEAFDLAYGQARTEVKRQLGDTASSHSRLLYFQRTIETLGFGTQPLLSLDLEQTYWRVFLNVARLCPSAEEVLIELRAAAIPLAVVTDLTAQIQFRKLIHFGIERYFDAVVTSEEAGVEKVGLTPFRLAMQKLGLSDGTRVWIVGDSASDIVSGKAALNACALQRCVGLRGVDIHAPADAAFDSFADLLQRLREALDRKEVVPAAS
jgi:FMN phosphatase YigB (HAD superfamily)